MDRMKDIQAYWNGIVKKVGCEIPMDTPLKSYVCFDIETTGANIVYNDIIEIGAVKVIDNTLVDTFFSLINPKKKIPDRIVELTGITNDMVKNSPPIGFVIKNFVEFIDKMPLTGYNIKDFDLKFIIRDYHRNYKEYLHPYYFDIYPYVKELHKNLKDTFNPINLKLTTLADYFDIDKGNSHRALDDATTTHLVFNKINELKDETLDSMSRQFSMTDYDVL